MPRRLSWTLFREILVSSALGSLLFTSVLFLFLVVGGYLINRLVALIA